MRKRFIAVLVVLAICLPLAALFSAHAAQVHLPFGIPFDTDYESLVPLFEEKTGVPLVAPEDNPNVLKTPDETAVDWEGLPVSVSFTFQEDGSRIEYASIAFSREALPDILLRDEAAAGEELNRQLQRLSDLFDALESRLGSTDASFMSLGAEASFMKRNLIDYQLPAKDKGMDIERVRASFLEHTYGRITKLYSNLLITIGFAKLNYGMGFYVENITYQSTLPSQEQWDEIMEYVSALPQYP